MIVVAKKWDYEADRKPFHSAYQYQPRRVYPRFSRKPFSSPLPLLHPTNPCLFFPSPSTSPPDLKRQEFFWTFPDLEPLYNAARSYLEIGQRVELLNARVDVLQDMLKLLKESVNSSHGERLEAIVIFLMSVLTQHDLLLMLTNGNVQWNWDCPRYHHHSCRSQFLVEIPTTQKIDIESKLSRDQDCVKKPRSVTNEKVWARTDS